MTRAPANMRRPLPDRCHGLSALLSGKPCPSPDRASVHPASSLKPQASSLSPAFTLVELLVASIITVFIAGATTVAVNQALKARAATQARLEARMRADAAAARIAADLRRTIRDTDLYFARLSIFDGGDSGRGGEPDELLLYVRSDRVVRPRSGQAEGDEHEAQYRLVAGAASRQNPASADAAGTLWRRVDPVPDEFADGGGVAAPIVAGVTSLSIDATDGQLWYATWDSDLDGYPHAVRIVVTASDDTGRYSATARRIIALDRTPQPFDTLLERVAEEEGGA